MQMKYLTLIACVYTVCKTPTDIYLFIFFFCFDLELNICGLFIMLYYFIKTFIRAKLEKMPSIPEEPEVPESEVERFTMPDFVKPLYDLDVVEGKEAILKCKVAGLPYPTISWFHNGKKIESTEDRKMTQCELLRYFI